MLDQLKWKRRINLCRLRLVPHFPSGIVERTKRVCAWKSSNARKARRGGERDKSGTTDKAQSLMFFSPRSISPFLRGVIFTRGRVSLPLSYTWGKQRMLVVYDSGNSGGSVQHATWNKYSVSDQNIWFSIPWTTNVKGWMTKKNNKIITKN